MLNIVLVAGNIMQFPGPQAFHNDLHTPTNGYNANVCPSHSDNIIILIFLIDDPHPSRQLSNS